MKFNADADADTSKKRHTLTNKDYLVTIFEQKII